MDIRKLVESWPVYRQLTGADPLGRGKAAQTKRSADADAAHRRRGLGGPHRLPVLCGRLRAEGVREGREGHPDRGRPGQPDIPRPAVPQGFGEQAAGHRPQREQKVRYRPPYATEWQELDLDTAMEMVADRVLDARQKGWQEIDADRNTLRRTHGHRQPGRRDPGQRRELPDQEALHRAGRDADREPGPYLTLRHGSRSGGLVRSRRGDELSAGPGQLGLHRHHGLEHGRGPSGRVPVGDGGQGARHAGRAHRPAVHPHQRGRRPATCRCARAATSPSSAG